MTDSEDSGKNKNNLLSEEYSTDEEATKYEFDEEELKYFELEGETEFIPVFEEDDYLHLDEGTEEELTPQGRDYEDTWLESRFSGYELMNDITDNVLWNNKAFIEDILSDIVQQCLLKVEHDNNVTEDVKNILDILIHRCTSMNRMAKDIITDLVEDFPSGHAICSEILNDLIDYDLFKEVPPEVSEPGSKPDTPPLSQHDIEYQDCYAFAGLNSIVEGIIDRIMVESKSVVGHEKGIVFSDSKADMHVTYMNPSNFRWTTIQNFSIDIGKRLISQYIDIWPYKEDWLYNVKYIMAQSDECNDFYLYEAKFGIPTNEYPIPQATVSVFFTMEVSRILPKTCPVNVTYVFEGNRVVHSSKKHPFNEDWLFGVVDAKLELFKRLDF